MIDKELLKEPSTWRGAVALLSALGIIITPEQMVHIISACLAISGAIGALVKDRKR